MKETSSVQGSLIDFLIFRLPSIMNSRQNITFFESCSTFSFHYCTMRKLLISTKFQECYCSDEDYCNELEDIMEQSSSGANPVNGFLAVVSAATAVTVAFANL